MTAALRSLPAMPNYGDPPVSVTCTAPGLCCTASGAAITYEGSPLALTIARRMDRNLYVMAEREPGDGHPRLFAAGAGPDAPTAIADALNRMAAQLEQQPARETEKAA